MAVSSMNVPPLTLRLEKGSPLTSEEFDEDIKILRDFCDGLARLFEVVFNADGTLKNNSVGESSIADRAVTQRKLHWLANFFCVASGVDDYVGTVNPTAGFSYGDGATTSFFLPVLFTNANTTAVTLNINGLGQKNVLKMVGTALAPIDAGDIAAGSIHLLAYDGTQFQLLSVIPRTDINTPPHGIPHFIAPVLIVNQPSGSAVAWQTYNTLAADGIPATASAIILQVDWCATDTGAGPAEIQVRRSSADSAYVAASLCPLAVADVQGMSSQGIYPFKNTVGVLSFDYQSTTNFNGEYNIRLIGYIS